METNFGVEKIVFSNLVLKKHLDSLKYNVDGSKNLQYEGEVVFFFNSILAKSLKKDEIVKVVLLKKLDAERNSERNEQIFKDELNKINKNIGAKIEYVTIESPFIETKDTHEVLLKNMIDQLEDDVELIADITYGPKPLTLAIFTMLRFAEKFFHAKIEHIIYGKVDFITNADKTTTPVNPVIYDLLPMYCLNEMTQKMEFKDSSDAKKALSLILDM